MPAWDICTIWEAEAFSQKVCVIHAHQPHNILFPAKLTLSPSICSLGRVSIRECSLCLSLAHTQQIPELSAWNSPESINSWICIPVRRQLSEEHLAPVSILSAVPSHIYFLKNSLLGWAGGKTGSRSFWLLKGDHPVALSNKSYIFPTKNIIVK